MTYIIKFMMNHGSEITYPITEINMNKFGIWSSSKFNRNLHYTITDIIKFEDIKYIQVLEINGKEYEIAEYITKEKLYDLIYLSDNTIKKDIFIEEMSFL